MYCVRKVTDDLYWVGANDHRLHLFENIHPIPRGVSYNAYLLLDEQSVLFDTVDWSAYRQLQDNLDHLLGDKPLDWLVVNHMEPDHGASVEQILRRYPKVKVISTEKSFMLMRQFGFHPDEHECVEVKEGDTHCFGKHTVTFVGAPMVHWPEAMVTFDTTNGGAGFLWTVPRLPPGPLGILPAGWTPGRLYRWTKVQAPPRRQEPLPNLSVLRLGAEGMAAHLQAPLRLPLIHAHPEGVGKPDRQPRIAAFHMKLSSLNIGLARSADNQGGRLLTVPGAGRSPGPRPDYQPGRVFRSAL